MVQVRRSTGCVVGRAEPSWLSILRPDGSSTVFAPAFSIGVVGVDGSPVVSASLAASAAAADCLFLRGAFSSIETRFPTCLLWPSCSSWMPLQNVTTGPSSLRLFNAAIFLRRSSSLCFSASSHLFKLFEFLFSTIAASARRSAWVMGGFFEASSILAFFSILSSCFLRLSSSVTIFWWSCCLLILVVWRSEARVGMSAGDGSQLVLSDFFFGRGCRTGCSMRTFFLNLAGMASCAFRFRCTIRFSRAWRSNSFSPSSSSVLASLSSSSEDESICTSDASSFSSSVNPASFSSSAKRSSRSESSAAGSSFASIDFIRFPAVDRFARDVTSHSTLSDGPASLSPSLLLVLPMSDSSSSDDVLRSSSSAAILAGIWTVFKVGSVALSIFGRHASGDGSEIRKSEWSRSRCWGGKLLASHIVCRRQKLTPQPAGPNSKTTLLNCAIGQDPEEPHTSRRLAGRPFAFIIKELDQPLTRQSSCSVFTEG